MVSTNALSNNDNQSNLQKFSLNPMIRFDLSVYNYSQDVQIQKKFESEINGYSARSS